MKHCYKINIWRVYLSDYYGEHKEPVVKNAYFSFKTKRSAEKFVKQWLKTSGFINHDENDGSTSITYTYTIERLYNQKKTKEKEDTPEQMSLFEFLDKDGNFTND